MDFKEAEAMTRQLMREHGLKGWSFRWGRGKRLLGSCEERRKIIRLSAPYVQINETSHVRDTVLHEIAHAIAGCKAGHSEAWKKVCRQIGANPSRVDRTASLPKAPYEIYCPGCKGVLAGRHRRPRLDVMQRMYCKGCGPDSMGNLGFRERAAAS